MLLTQIFWAAFLLPGYALVRHLWPRVHEAGLLHVVGVGYLASFVLLSPISIAGYVFGLPLWVFSASGLLYLCVAAVVLVRARADREWLAMLRAEPALAMALLLAHLILQARVGAYLSGDAQVHVAHIRYLLEHGFSNRDVYLADYHFHHIYHTNLLYAVYGSLAQLTHQDYLDAWFFTQAWAKLLVAAGHYSLAYVLCRKRWASWLAALVVITANAGESYTLYPNTLAVGWLLPLMLAFGWSAWVDAAERRGSLLALGATGFVVGQVHSLYAIYAGLVLAPLFVCVWLVGYVRAPRASWAALALVMLLTAAPFVLVSKFAFLPPNSGIGASSLVAAPRVQAPPEWAVHSKSAAVRAGGGHLEKQLRVDASGRNVMLPEHMGGLAFIVSSWLALLACVFVYAQQRRAWLGAAVAAALLSSILFVPAVCAAALRVLLESFVVARLSTVLASILLLALAALLAWLVDRFVPHPAARSLGLVAGIAAAACLPGQAPRTLEEHVRLAASAPEQRRQELHVLQERAALLARTLPSRATVLTTARMARPLVMVCDCFVIAADRGHTHVEDIATRRADLVTLTDPGTVWPLRRGLLDHYAVHFVVYEQRRRRAYDWAREHGRVMGAGGGLEVVQLL